MPKVQGSGARNPAGEKKGSRKDQILQSLAKMLEAEPGGRITTAALAREVGVSEAALYRHFPSKTRMFEDLIAFIEESLFSTLHALLREHPGGMARCQHLSLAVLQFCESQPGVARILTGDAITGENERLRQQVMDTYERLGTQLRQVLKDAESRDHLRTRLGPAESASLLLTMIEGRLCRFVRSDFRQLPTEQWDLHWRFLSQQLFVAGSPANA